MGIIDWNTIDEYKFEDLCKELLSEKYNNYTWEKYLKRGNKQKGIDIRTFNFSNGKWICVQCKKYTKFINKNITDCQTAFLAGEFSKTTEKFIIITSADLQSKKLKDSVDKSIREFREEHDIELIWWDKTNLEDELIKYYDIVSKYFSIYTADKLCYPHKSKNWQTFNCIESFLPRKITEIKNHGNEENYYLHNIQFNFKVLEDLFQKESSTLRLCLIADAYIGKSTLLKQFCYNCRNTKFIPILIDIKAQTIRDSIEKLLHNSYSFWKNYPTQNIIIILDGLDEVEQSNITKCAKGILEFSKNYPDINIIVSCRRIYYIHYDLIRNLSSFDSYEIAPLSHEEIKEFAQKELGNNYKNYEYFLEYNNLQNIVSYPFFLKKSIEWFRQNKSTLKTKIDLLDRIIDDSTYPLYNREIIDNSLFKDKIPQYILCLKKIALYIQSSNSNILNHVKVARIIQDSALINTILQSSLLTKNKNENIESWSFVNQYFQESFAALALKDLPIEQIEELITVGKSKKKIKQNWLQTAFTLISILDEPTKTSKLIELIEQDNIELLAFCETSTFNYDFRLDAFKKIIKQCIEKERFPIICDTRALALLISGKRDGLDYILSELENDHPQFIKNLLWQIIYYHDSFYDKKKVLTTLTNTLLENSEDENYISILLDIQTKFGLLNKNTVAKLLNNDSLISNYWILSNILKAITNKGWVDEFYPTAINRIELYENKPKTSTVYAPEHRFEDFLLQTNNTDNIDILLKFVSRNIHKIIHRYTNKGNDIKLFYEEIVKKALSAYKNKKRVIKPMISIVKELLNSIELDHLQVLIHFFDITKKRYQLFRSCFSDPTKYWRYPVIMDAKCEEYIFSEYNNGKINNYPLDRIYNQLYSVSEELAEQYYNRTKSITGYDIKNDYIEYWKKIKHDDETRKLNDIKAIQSQEDFSKALQLYYNARGNKWIENYDRYNDAQRQSDSNFINSFLGTLEVNTNSLSLKDCEKYINDKNWFEDFRAKAIYHYNFPDEISKKKILPILEKYYYSEVKKASFENAIIQSSSAFNISHKEKLLADIYTKFLIPTEDKILVKFLWLVHDGFNHLKPNRYFSRILNEHNALNKIILKNVKDISILKQALITNLKNGINSELVRNSHLEYCRELNITEATDIIIQLITERKFQDHNYKDAVDIFLELEGDTNELLELLNNVTDYNSELFIALIEKLIKIEPYEVEDKLKIALNNVESKEKQNEIGLFLIKLGEEIGLETVINNLINCELYEHIDYKIRVPDLSKIDTRIALNNLGKIKSHFLDDDDYRNRPHVPSKKDFLLDCLYNLSRKSEYDLELVESFLLTTIEDLKKTHENANVIYYHIDRIIERYRETTNKVEESKLFEILDNIKL